MPGSAPRDGSVIPVDLFSLAHAFGWKLSGDFVASLLIKKIHQEDEISPNSLFFLI